MRGFHYLLEAFSAHDVNHPHRVHLSDVICKLMAYDTPDQDDIAVIIQVFAMQPFYARLTYKTQST